MTSASVSAQVQLCQMPYSFSRYAGLEPRSRAFRASSFGKVSGSAVRTASLMPPMSSPRAAVSGCLHARGD